MESSVYGLAQAYSAPQYCIMCQKVVEGKKFLKTDKGLICEDHLAKTNWKWRSATDE